MSIYSSIIESKVSNTGFEIDLGFFSKFFPVQGSLQWWCTLSVTKLGTPDIHPPDFPLHAVDFSPSRFPEEAKWKCLPWNRARVALAPFGTACAAPVCNVGRGEGCLCSASALLPSLLLPCGQTFVRAEGKLLAVSARNPVAPSMALMRQVPLEILLQNSEVNTSLIKTQVRYHQQITINYLHEQCSEKAPVVI